MVLAAKPGHSATVLVALATTAGTRVKSKAGKETKLPPPATALSVPAIAAAKNSSVASLKCKLLFIRKTELLRSESLAVEIQHDGAWKFTALSRRRGLRCLAHSRARQLCFLLSSP